MTEPEAIPPAWQRFDKTRMLGGFVQGFAQFPDSTVQPDFEVDEGFRRPEHAAKLVARNHVPRPGSAELEAPGMIDPGGGP